MKSDEERESAGLRVWYGDNKHAPRAESNIISAAQEKQSAVADKIVCDESRHLFLGGGNEQASDEVGRGARKRELASLSGTNDLQFQHRRREDGSDYWRRNYF